MDTFKKTFWTEKLENIKNDVDHIYVVVDGDVFVIENEDSDYFRGFNSRKFKIKFFDGAEKTTSNLWHIGSVPKEFEYLIVNNAEFIKG